MDRYLVDLALPPIWFTTMFKGVAVGALVACAVSGVVAQQPIYAQCGGISWTGMTFCVERGRFAKRIVT